MKAPAGMAECPDCNLGYTGMDEEGKWYPCYRCGTSGWVPVESTWPTREESCPAHGCMGGDIIEADGSYGRCPHCQGTGKVTVHIPPDDDIPF